MATSTIKRKLPNELGNFCLCRYSASGTSSAIDSIKITLASSNQWSPILYYDSDGGVAVLVKQGSSTFSAITLNASSALTQLVSSQSASSNTEITATVYGNRRYCFIAYQSISVEEV